MSITAYQTILSRHPLFGQLMPEDVGKLAGYAKLQSYKRKQTIFLKGSQGTGLMAVLKGEVRISAPSPDGREITLNTVGEGDIFGEIALLDGKERTADAVAVTDTELMVIERRDFIPFIGSRPEVAVRLLAIVCERLRRTTEQVGDLLFLDLPARLAKKLLALAEEHGQAEPRGIRLTIQLSQRQLGNLVGMSRESINKQLRAWQQDGVVETIEGVIWIRDRQALEDASVPQ